MEEYTVYMHRCPNGKVYVGITSCSPKIRWANGNGYKGHKRFYEDIIKYGWDNIQHLILFEKLSMEHALRKEKDLIKQYNARDKNFGYNVRSGGQLGPYSIDTINGKERKIDFKFRVSEKEKEEIEEMADDMGFTVSAFLRYLVAKERELTNEIERIRRREKRTTISEREKEAFRYFVAKEREEKRND